MKRGMISWAARFSVVSAILSASVLTLLGQDFTIHMKSDDGADMATYYVSSTAIRKTTPGIYDIIDRIDRGTIIHLDHRSKTYTEMPVAQAHEAITKGMANMDPQKQAMLHNLGLDAPAQLTKIGPGENIAGYPTEKYSIKTGMVQGTLWITQSLQFPAAYYRDFNLLSGVGGPFGGIGKIAEVHGVVLKRTMAAALGRGTNVSETAASVEKGSIPASTFEPPAGYRKVTGRDSAGNR